MKKTIRHFTFGAGIVLLALCFRLAPLPMVAAEAPAVSTNTTGLKIKPGPDDGRVAYWTARLLQDYHYLQHRFDQEISNQFLDRYLEMLDGQHLYFLAPDLTDFERYRTNLEKLTLTRTGVSDLTPAFKIFACYYQRLQQRVAWVDELLKNEKFQFDSDERIAFDRREAPYPQDLPEAKALWRQRLRYEYLQEQMEADVRNAKVASTNGPSDQIESPEAIRKRIVDKLTHRYHRLFLMFSQWDNEDVLGVYLTALARVYDPHSDYFNRAQLNSFKISMNLELFGIGAELHSDEEGYCKIAKLLPLGPASISKKIDIGDRIVAVAQSNQPPVDVVDMHLTKVVQLIRGPKGSEVRLTIAPEGAKSGELKIVKLIRDEIPLDEQAAKGRIIEMPDGQGDNVRLGVIDLPSFYAPMGGDDSRKSTDGANTNRASSGYASIDVARWLTKFKQEHVSGVILDLRLNGGGSLEEAIRLTGLFIKDGPVVQAREPGGSVKVDRDLDPTIVYDGPLIVLTSRFSASASEIVAAALQDYGRAVIVGDSSTHGKGTVQTVSYLSSLPLLSDSDQDKFGALKFTIRKFYRPTGVSTQLKGVMPDIVLPSKLNYAKDIGEKSLENPLASDTVTNASFEKLDLVQPYLTELLQRSSLRVGTNVDFTFVREDIELFRKEQADKTVSLNEKQLLKEREESEARQKVREKELRALPKPNEKIYEITLKQVDLPGLPSPLQKSNSLAQTQASPMWQDLSRQPVLPGGAVNSGTNNAGAVPPLAARTADADDADNPDKPSLPDADLNEAKRILIDYIFLRAAGHAVTGGVASKPSG